MPISKISARNLKNVGVIGLRDVPALGAAALQEKFEETARSVIIPKVNEIIDRMYTRGEVDTVINARIQQLGSGDMAKAVYDSDNDGLVDLAANSAKLGGHTAGYFATATALDAVRQTAAGAIQRGQVTAIQVVSALPASPVNGVLYLVTGE